MFSDFLTCQAEIKTSLNKASIYIKQTIKVLMGGIIGACSTEPIWRPHTQGWPDKTDCLSHRPKYTLPTNRAAAAKMCQKPKQKNRRLLASMTQELSPGDSPIRKQAPRNPSDASTWRHMAGATNTDLCLPSYGAVPR